MALKRYAGSYPAHVKHPDAPLIYSAKGLGFTAQTIVNLFATLYKAAGIDGASSHSGRRQFVTTLADKGINPRVVQVLVRHRHLNTTMRYIDVNDAKLRKAVEMVD
jgi:integrase/recombinase XerD